MALNAAALQVGAAALAPPFGYLSIHTANPGTGGANESTAARQASTITATAGNLALTSARNFTGGAASGPALYVGIWSTATNGTGTFYGAYPLTGDQAFNAAGQYTLNAMPLTGSST